MELYLLGLIVFTIMLAVVYSFSISDPVKSCEYHKKHGCSHVDGYMCDMYDCEILKQFKKEWKN